MGGSLTVILREENGNVHIHEGWTNSLPWFINNIKFVEKNQNHINEYLKNLYSSKINNEKLIAPQDYGIVLLDFQNNKILSHQNYCSFGKINKVHLLLELTDSKYINAFYEDDDELYSVRFKEFHENNRVSHAILYNNNLNLFSEDIINTKDMTLNDISNYITQNPMKRLDFILDMKPFEILNYHHNILEEGLKMKNEIINLGFNLTQDEEKAWINFYNNN